MVGSPLLTIGLLLRTCATFQKILGSNSVIQNLNISSCPLLFLALVFFFKKAYQLMRLPVLCCDNFRFFGLILYGGSIITNAILSIVQSNREMSSMTYGFTVSITNILAFYGTCVFLLDASRVKHHCNAILEDRYPSTTYLVWDRIGFRFANISSCIGFTATFACTITNLQIGNDGNVSQNKSFSSSVIEFVASFGVAVSMMLLCFCTLRPSLYFAVEKNEKSAQKFIRLLMMGCTLIAIGTVSNGLGVLILYFDSDAMSTITIRILNSITIIGSIFLVLASWPNKEAVCKIHLTQPYKWDNVYHPSNYVLLTSFWFFSGSVCMLTNVKSLAWLFYSWGYVLLLLHFQMAFYVWESMNLQPSSKDIVIKNVETNESIKSDKLDFKLPEESFDVIISGGGISGLFLACILSKQGVKIALCERRKESITDARFAVLNSSSMEYMEAILDPDLLTELESRALPQSTHFGSMVLSGLGHPKARVIAAANSPSRRVLMQNLDKIDD